MNLELLLNDAVRASTRTVANRTTYRPAEWAITPLRDAMPVGRIDNPGALANYWRANIATVPDFTPEVENLYVVMLTTQKGVIGHLRVSMGTIDTCWADARAVFRPAIIANAHSVAIAHNHPSGDPTPSDADRRVTRELARAGELLRIELTDHIIMGSHGPNRIHDYVSLRELGHLWR